jgi:hypothetical protein
MVLVQVRLAWVRLAQLPREAATLTCARPRAKRMIRTKKKRKVHSLYTTSYYINRSAAGLTQTQRPSRRLRDTPHCSNTPAGGTGPRTTSPMAPVGSRK